MKKVYLLLALALVAAPLARAEENHGGITEECDTRETRAKAAALIESTFAIVGGKVNRESVRTTTVVPKQILGDKHTPALLATAEVTTPSQDGSEWNTGVFAIQFTMDYDTCTPAFAGSGLLEKF